MNLRGVGADVVIDVVAAYYGISAGLLLSKSRAKRAAEARATAMYLLRMLLEYSYSEIAAIMERVDHGTVMHACRRATERIARDAGYKSDIEVLRASVARRRREHTGTRELILELPAEVWLQLQSVHESGLFGPDVEDTALRLMSNEIFRLIREKNQHAPNI